MRGGGGGATYCGVSTIGGVNFGAATGSTLGGSTARDVSTLGGGGGTGVGFAGADTGEAVAAAGVSRHVS
jgi:hypothetical protein